MERIVTPNDFEELLYNLTRGENNYQFVRGEMDINATLRRQLGDPNDRQTILNRLEAEITQGRVPRISFLFEENSQLEQRLARRQAQERRREQLRQEEEARRLAGANALIQLSQMNPRNQFVSLSKVLRDTRPSNKRKK